MANGAFYEGMRELCRGNINWAASGGTDVRALLIDHADDTPAVATDDHLSDIAGAAQEEVTGALTLIDAADDGVLDLNDFVFVAATGDPCESIVFYKHTGTGSTSDLLFFFDTATGLPVTLNGGDVNVTINASGLVKV